MLNGDGNAGLNQMRDENMGKMVQNGGDGNTAIRDDERNGVVGVRDYEKETRMKRYKEERRKQLEQVAAKVNATATTTITGRENRRLQGQTPNSPRRFITRPKSTTPNPSTVSDCVRGDGSSGSDGLTVRTTRASRLRAARVNAADTNTANNKKLAIPTTIVSTPLTDGKERSPLSLSTDASCASLRISRQEKDKSSKRKSNLNRSLNTEEVPSPDSHDESINSRRRRRRVLNPSDILVSLNESGLSSGSTSTSARVTPLPSPSTTSQPRTSVLSTSTTTTTSPAATASPRRTSELRIHMENARRGVISTDCATKPRQAPMNASLEASTKLVARQMMIASWDGNGTPKTNKSNLMTASLDGSLKSRQTPVKRVYTSSARQRNDTDRKKSSSEQEEYYSLSDREFRLKKTTGERKASSSDEKVVRHHHQQQQQRRVSGASGEFDNKCGSRKVFGDKKVNVPSASKTNDISKRMDELTAFTKETLARVERLTNRSQLSPRREILDRKKSPEKVLNRNNRIASEIKTLSSSSSASNEKLNNSVQQSSSMKLEHLEENGIYEDPDPLKPSPILKLKKKQSQEEAMVPPLPPPPPASVHIHGPVSILKRKSSQDEAGNSSCNTLSFTTPVTFSPTVVDPIPNRKKPGILKKRCSLDESHVIRRRSYSPDVALVEGSSDYRPILKNQRRSSLEEIVRTRSPDNQQPQGILKRKHSRGEEEFGECSQGSPEPQSILKRKSGTSSSGSSGNSPHVSIATAVILAAAGGAEIILEPSEPVKPILKKKSFSDENPNMDSLNPEVPKPILKKKSSTETDDQDDRPMKPILKSSRKCSQDENYSSNEHSIESPRYYSVLRNRSNHNSGESGSECETAVRPILKQSSSRENSPRPRLSFCNDNDDSLLNRSSSPRSPDAASMRRSKFVRRSNTVADADLSSIVNLKRSFENKETPTGDCSKEEPHVPKRPISVFEIVMNFEKTTNSNSTSTGAIPKRSSLKGSRNSGRFRTQPITLDEFEATQILETVQNFQSTTCVKSESQSHSQSYSHTSPIRIQDSVSPCSISQKETEASSLGDLSHSLDLSTLSSSNNDSQLTTPSSMPNESADSGVASKMSFVNENENEDDKQQDCSISISREDDLSPQELCRSNSVSAKASMFKQLEAQMKAVADEAKALRLSRGGNKGMQRYRNRKQAATCPNAENRFSTQPVTLDEVQEAVKANQRANESPDENNVATAESTTSTTTTTTTTSDEADPSKLSLAERVKLFNQKITQERLPVAPGGGPGAGAGIVRKTRQARFKTQPITSEEVETAQKISPLAASLVKPPESNVLEGLSIRATKDKMYEHAAKMLTNEVRGILKSKSAISPILPTNSSSSGCYSQPPTLTSTSTSNGHQTSKDKSDESSDDEGVSITISTSTSTSTSPDETTSSTFSRDRNHKNKKEQRAVNKRESNNNEKENKQQADIETLNRKNRDMSEMKLKVDECMKELEIRNKVRRHLEEVQQMSSSDGTPQTSDGESSGGREVKRIISNDAVARRRQAAINRQKEKNNTTLVKSKSQSSIVRDLPRTPLFSRSVHLDKSSGDRATDGAAPVAALVRGGVRRSLTLPLRPDRDSDGCSNEMPGGGTIADRLAELQNSGNNEWRKRLPKLNTANDELIQLNSIVTKNIYNDTLSSDTISEKSSILAAKDKLETASQQWKKRVEVNDAINFSVAGRMHQESKELVVSPLIVAAQGDKMKKTPKAERFRGKESEAQTISTPVSPEKICKIKFTRSVSAPGVGEEEIEPEDTIPVAKTEGRLVLVPRPDDETFTTFFESVTKSTSQSEHLEVTGDDLDSVQRQSTGLLVTKKTVRVQRKHAGTTRNPIKALAARSDIKEEYTEIITGVAEREKRRINVEKLAKHSSMAIEALAGLASKEDFTAIALKKGTGNTNSSLVPYKDLMLLHIKGRRHVQTRLVEPVAASINQGDNFVLVTPTQVYNYVGPYSNIIEQSRGAEIAQHIQQKKDLNCKCNTVITIHEGKNKCTRSQLETFWKLLGATLDHKVTEAGYPDEDEIYESAIILTNMVYELDNNELVPVESYWGSLPKIEMLDSSKVLVFDFGSEMYIWSGRNVPIEQRKEAAKLAKELWENGYNYTDCTICPVNSVVLLGSRGDVPLEKKGDARPDWALICKITQHGETILFREKFLDWPDFSRVIKVKNSDSDKIIDGSITVNPCDAEEMRAPVSYTPDLILEGSHLGRGTSFYDEETNRHFEVATLAIKAWHILEYEYEELPVSSIGQFYNGDSYIIRWQYMMTVTGRELSGKPSKHSMLGRDRCAYFCWQGKHAPLNEKGAAALLTVELDLERGPQVRVTQGAEPSVFLSLFEGTMTVHSGRRENEQKATKRLYMCRGEMENEMHLIEVACSVRKLRSRTSFLLTDCQNNTIYIWHGAKSTKNNRNLSVCLANKIQTSQPSEFQFNDTDSIRIIETEEGDECPEFRELLGCTNNNRHLYFSLLKSSHSFEHTPRMFHLSSVSGVFKSNEIHCPHQSDDVTPYPFIQNDLFSASQPALFLIDNGHELWLWQGWWPETDSDSDSDSERPYSDQTGSGQHRWQAERRAAMRTALDYWQGPKDKGVPAYLVWAGLEPLEFTNLFPTWTDRDDIAELNIRDGRKPGELLRIENELARLTQSTYPLVQLLQRPLPEGVDPTHLEDYLSSEDFVTLLGMTKPEFQKLPTWKQTNIKKDKGLF